MLIEDLQNDLKNAQLAQDGLKVSTLRLLLSEIKNAQIAKGADLSNDELTSIIQKEVKKRKEAATGFRSGGREESAQKEELEAKVLEVYLPSQLSNEQLTKLVEDTINEIGAKSLADMGKVMGAVMGKVAGKADGGMVSSIVKEKLTH